MSMKPGSCLEYHFLFSAKHMHHFTAFAMSLPAYRHLWRAARIAFKGLDFSGLFEYLLLTFLLSQAMTESSQQHNSRYGKPTDPSYSSAIQKAEDIAKILRENVVQGKQDDSRVFKLRIHEDTERGDNDSIKMAGGGSATMGGCGCS
ncbi:uncharacterized protein CLUP02_08423 [Colletotrichum lupini]|uniref:Uncharacterized protein n=1 Tax=Colletotrichum lupini TaxID=145971 RepID=A0A9Q8ST25_9PEZI|nr:uncharacterized protein CLUP02_08423 [Colletotrichum lupini]UQC82933.1 hypothetical protein CLUP02_08423 [Colletotrichum lupini]